MGQENGVERMEWGKEWKQDRPLSHPFQGPTLEFVLPFLQTLDQRGKEF